MNKTTLIQVGGVLVELLTDGDAICRMTNNNKAWEPGTRSLWAGLIRPGDMMIDVGAYTGVYSIASAMLGAKVIAIEPHPANYKRLRVNAALNSIKIEMIEAAASSYSGVDRLCTKRSADVICDTASLIDATTVDVAVKTIRIDDVKLCARVGLIKIDVEHGEEAVLMGGIRTIASHRPTVICEVLSEHHKLVIDNVMSALAYRCDVVIDQRNHFYRYRA